MPFIFLPLGNVEPQLLNLLPFLPVPGQKIIFIVFVNDEKTIFFRTADHEFETGIFSGPVEGFYPEYDTAGIRWNNGRHIAGRGQKLAILESCFERIFSQTVGNNGCISSLNSFLFTVEFGSGIKIQIQNRRGFNSKSRHTQKNCRFHTTSLLVFNF